MSYFIHQFPETYNGHIIANPTGDDDAIYYTFSIGDRQYLQTHQPFLEGFIPVYADDIDIIENHIASLQ